MSADDDSDQPRAPRHANNLFGHRAAEKVLLASVRSGRLPHAWLIGGPAGIGKATFAWRLARFLLAHPDPNTPAVLAAADLDVPSDHPAARKMAAGSHGDVVALERKWNDKTKKLYGDIRIDDVRAATAVFRNAAAEGGYRICIIDTADDLNRSSANALLKIIEEPPPRSVFLILAHRPGQVMPTIVSRCRRLALKPLGDADLERAVRSVLGSAAPTASAFAAVASRAQGSVGRALELLEGGTLERDGKVLALLEAAPAVDWRRVHALADRLGTSGEAADAVLDVVFEWLDARVHRHAGVDTPAALAEVARVWAAVRDLAREADMLNLDKRALLVSIFHEIAKLPRAA